MKIVILDGYTENPGDLSWAPLAAFGDLTVYDRTPYDDQEIAALKKIIAETIRAYDGVSYHDLHYNKNLSCYHVDLSIPYSYDLKRNDIAGQIETQIRAYREDIQIRINVDRH